MVSIKPVKMAMRFALVGCLISILFFSFWLLDEHFNFFNLPTEEQARAMGSFSQPALLAFLERANFILCPPYIITSFAGMDLGKSANFILWGISCALNTALYFVLGLAFAAVWNRWFQFELRAKS
jgi:hypothetical protein